MTTAHARCHDGSVADADEEKALLTAEITRAAHDGWHTFAGRRNIDLVNLAEIVGRALAEMTSVPTDELPELLQKWTSDAAALQSQKRLEARMKRRKT